MLTMDFCNSYALSGALYGKIHTFLDNKVSFFPYYTLGEKSWHTLGYFLHHDKFGMLLKWSWKAQKLTFSVDFLHLLW